MAKVALDTDSGSWYTTHSEGVMIDMATTHIVVRKNGIPVKRFWREKITPKSRETWKSTYPIYFHGLGFNMSKLTGDKAPHTLAEAEQIAKTMIESPDDEWTMAIIYELRAMVRYGTELDFKQYEKENRER